MDFGDKTNSTQNSHWFNAIIDTILISDVLYDFVPLDLEIKNGTVEIRKNDIRTR